MPLPRLVVMLGSVCFEDHVVFDDEVDSSDAGDLHLRPHDDPQQVQPQSNE